VNLTLHSDKIKKLLPKIWQVIDLGSGFDASVEANTITITITFLKSLKDFPIYTALNTNEEFLKLAARKVTEYFPNAKTRCYKCNFLSKIPNIEQLL
jgi:hypothetical protein